MQRKCGLMLHITSLPNKYGFGCFSKEAFEFVDFLKKSGQHYWQVLPFNPTNESGSPFQCYSVFAGNPCFIDLTEFLSEQELASFGVKPTKKINFSQILKTRISALKFIFERDFEKYSMENFKKQNSFWLEDYATFMAIKDCFGGVEFAKFPEGLKQHDKKALQEFKSTHQKEIDFHVFVQFLFFKQWEKIKQYANSNDVEIIGDIAFYPATDSSDIWAQREEFLLDKNCCPKVIAGVPPDYFSEDGQLWGNTVYNVEKMKENNFTWWLKRFEQANKFYDVVRLDHFRGFESFWVCPAGAETAKKGKWQKSFGEELFNELKKHKVPTFIAEDLGVITPKVKELMNKFSFPGMRVFQFAFDGNPKNLYFPHNYIQNSVAYIGTHDNNTFVGFLKEISPETLSQIKNFLCLPQNSTYEQITDTLFSIMLNSLSQTVILTVQDILYLDERYRMNTPGTEKDNWDFVLPKNKLTNKIAEQLRKLVIASNRI